MSNTIMNLTGNYHMPVKHFMECNGYKTYLVDARGTEHLRIAENLGREQSNTEDASILASTLRLDSKAPLPCGHDRLPEFSLTRMLEQLKSNRSAPIALFFTFFVLYRGYLSILS